MIPNTRRKALVNTLQGMTPKSGELYHRAEMALPGGAVGGGIHQNPWPIYMQRGTGACIQDIDGNSYIDCSLGSGSLLFGHSHPCIQAAIEIQNKNGIMHSGYSPLTVPLAEKLARIFPCSEKLIFCNSGTEAVHKSILLARAFTKKNKIAKFEGSYHGTYDQSCLSVNKFSTNGNDPFAIPMIAGIPQRAIDDTVVLPFNNTHAFDIIDQHKDELAAIIVEPIATIGLFSMSKNFLVQLRELSHAKGILLIFDEVLTGFHVGYGGCQSYFSVTPDIAVYGKALGGGTPIGSVGCNDDLLYDLLNASPPLRLGGTFSGNPLSMAAANAVLDLCIDSSRFSFNTLENNCRRFAETLNQKLLFANLPVFVSQVGSMFFVHINNIKPLQPRDFSNEDMKRLDELCLRLRINGVYVENAHTGFFSSAHTEDNFDRLIEVFFKCISDCFV